MLNIMMLMGADPQRALALLHEKDPALAAEMQRMTLEKRA